MLLTSQQQTLKIAAVADGGSTCPVRYTPGVDPTPPPTNARLPSGDKCTSVVVVVVVVEESVSHHLSRRRCCHRRLRPARPLHLASDVIDDVILSE